MKEEMRDILDFQVPIQVYESVEEADKAAGMVGATLRKALDLLLFHGTYADGRELITECVQEVTKVPFLTKKEKDEKGVEVEERDLEKDSDGKYAKRALALKPDLKPQIQSLITQRARGYKGKDEKGVEFEVPALAVDIKSRPRTGPKAKTLAKKFMDVAREFLSGKKNLKKFTEVLAKQGIGTFTPVKAADGKELPLTAEENVLQLGWLCKAWSDAQDVFKAVS